MSSLLLNRARKELSDAEGFLQNGLAGRSRVCARRASGAAIQYYLEESDAPIHSVNAYDLLLLFQSNDQIPAEVRQASQILTTRVDENFNLQAPMDPIQAARLIIQWVLSQYPESD